MQKIDFVTFCGIEIGVDEELLSAKEVVRKAQKHYQTEVVCTPGMFAAKSCSFGWKIEKKDDASLLGVLVLSTGWYLEPIEFGGDPLKVFIPFGTEWAQIHRYKVRYIDGTLEIQKAE